MPEYKPCPNCKEKIEQNALLCKYCGLNVETGESYSAKMDRGKSYRKDTGPGRQSLAFGFIILFALLILGGIIYQSRIFKAINQSPEKYTRYVIKLNKTNNLIANKKYDTARKDLEDLKKTLKQEKSQLKDKDENSGEKNIDNRITLLSNLLNKTNRKLSEISSQQTN